ncbi:hypothetical protein J6590_096144 [Homalodisca vitripennis]|nr:hypothetical protein J6590_096144 [Homalodisca vitripennis]
MSADYRVISPRYASSVQNPYLGYTRHLQANAVPAVMVLYLLTCCSFLISFMMITDINNAIVAMVKLPTPSTNQNSTQDNPVVCYDHSLNSSSTNVYVCSHHEADQETREREKVENHPSGFEQHLNRRRISIMH